MPFQDAALAASVGKSVSDFDTPPTREHLLVVFDAIAQSKSSLCKRTDADERINTWRAADGSFDEEGFGKCLQAGSVSVLAANFVLYFLISCGAAIVGRVALDVATGSA